VQPVQPSPASPGKSEKGLIIKILDLSAADAAGAAGVPEQKISRARRLKKYKNTTYNKNIIIILSEVADTSEASLGFPLRPYTYWLKRGARDFLKREGYPAASAAPASPAGVIPKKQILIYHLATKCGGCSWGCACFTCYRVDLRTIFHARMLCWCVLTGTSHPRSTRICARPKVVFLSRMELGPWV
jgi:hypothetical protein